MRCIYLDKRDFLSEEDMRIHTACVCMNKESDKYKTFSIDDMEGLLCEVKYKEISQDKVTGLESLQFPVFVGIRTDKTEVSYS